MGRRSHVVAMFSAPDFDQVEESANKWIDEFINGDLGWEIVSIIPVLAASDIGDFQFLLTIHYTRPWHESDGTGHL